MTEHIHETTVVVSDEMTDAFMSLWAPRASGPKTEGATEYRPYLWFCNCETAGWASSRSSAFQDAAEHRKHGI